MLQFQVNRILATRQAITRRGTTNEVTQQETERDVQNETQD